MFVLELLICTNVGILIQFYGNKAVDNFIFEPRFHADI